MLLENTSTTNNNVESKKGDLGEGASFNDIQKSLQENATAKIRTLNSANMEKYTNSGKLGKVIKMMTNVAVYRSDFPKNIA